MDGLILIDKPRGVTSHDVVLRVRKILGLQKTGHFGTLDPLATGLLLVAVGKATKLFPFYSKKDKLYSGRIRLGFSTDTYDCLGKPTAEERNNFPDRETLSRAMAGFIGEQEQLPPLYSAKKLEGRPLYRWARSKKSPLLKASPISILAFDLKAYDPPFLDFETRCSSGTYIRSLAHDLGKKLGCGAHLAELRRLEIGPFAVGSALSLEEAGKLADRGEVRGFLLPLESLLPEFPKIVLNQAGERDLQRSKPLAAESLLEILPALSPATSGGQEEQVFRLFSPKGKFLALARRDSEKKALVPFLLLI